MESDYPENEETISVDDSQVAADALNALAADEADETKAARLYRVAGALERADRIEIVEEEDAE